MARVEFTPVLFPSSFPVSLPRGRSPTVLRVVALPSRIHPPPDTQSIKRLNSGGGVGVKDFDVFCKCRSIVFTPWYLGAVWYEGISERNVTYLKG